MVLDSLKRDKGHVHSRGEGKMLLTNFGAILNFAEELEIQDRDFYQVLCENASCSDYKEIFDQFSSKAKKTIKNIQRTRRENVTEMILEPIRDFERSPFGVKGENGHTMPADVALNVSKQIEKRSVQYYTAAAEKIKALQEVTRELKKMAKHHQAQLDILNNL